MIRRQALTFSSLVLVLLTLSAAAEVTAPAEKEADPFGQLEWRNVGPVNMTGRVADVEGVPGDPNVVWVGSASGGVWKSTNGGLSFKPVFDDQPVASIGDLALAPSNPDVVYVGSGESNTRNSVSFGNGVYKTTDGGLTWTHVGLTDTRHISRVAVHPSDPDTAWVAAVGHIFGPHEARGVYKTSDGGATWEKTLYVDERHGASDLDLDPTNPNVLFAGMWLFERKPWTFESGSENGGVYRSSDGGVTWKRLTEGLPKLMGRIAVKIAPSNPQVVYVMAESNEGVLFRSEDRGETFQKVNDDQRIVSRGFYYTDLRVDPSNESHVFSVSSRLHQTLDGGKTFSQISQSTHVDYHSLWIDPENPRRMWQGQDGGIAVSYDGGATWEPIRNIPIAQLYQVFHDDRQPFYYLGGGLQDNGTWYGPSRTREPAGILPDDWRMMSFGDAYFVVAHPEKVDFFLSESQGGAIVRTDMTTRQQVDVSPQPRRNDGGPAGELTYRFNWNAPIVASPHDPSKVYFAGNVVFESTDFGDTWRKISEDLTTDDPEKQGEAGGPVWTENTTAEYHCTIISFAESPAEAGVLWAGTDDGNLQVSRDGGESWTNVVGNVPGLPANSPVSHVEPSRTGGGIAYAAFDRHMFDDPRPHLYKTSDYGSTWTRLQVDGIPADGYVWVLREDPRNHDLLYAGTELGLYASYDAGSSWRRLRLKNLPTVAVHDVLIHPRANDLILGTHGRAIYVFDDATPIQDWNDGIAAETAHLFSVRPAIRFPSRFTRYGLGDKVHVSPNPPAGALVTYHLREDDSEKPGEKGKKDGGDEAAEEGAAEEEGKKQEERVKVEILGADGEVLRTLKDVGKKAGVNRVSWDLRGEPAKPRHEDDGGRHGGFFGPPGGPYVLPGTYTVRLTVDGESWETPVEVGVDPTVDASEEGLREQHDVVRTLTDLQTEMNGVLRGVDAIRAQVKDRRETAKALEVELGEDAETALKDLEEKLKELVGSLAREEGERFWSVGPRLVENLGGLGRELDGGFGAPTAAQKEYFAELEAEVEAARTAWRTIREETLPQVNTALGAAGIPGVLVPEAKPPS